MPLGKGQIKINNETFTPKSIKITFESLTTPDSGRTDSGKMMIDWVYRRKRKIDIEMAPCSGEEVAALLTKIQGTDYYMTYFDPFTNAERSAYFYTNSAKLGLYSGVIRNGLYQGFTFTALEKEGEL